MLLTVTYSHITLLLNTLELINTQESVKTQYRTFPT